MLKTQIRPDVRIPIGSWSCSHSSGNPTSARCTYAHRFTVGPTAAMLVNRRRPAVGPHVGSWSGQCWICSAYARHLLGKPTSARCWHLSPASRRAEVRFNRHLVGMLSAARHQADRHSAFGPMTFAAFGPRNLPLNAVIGPTSGRCRIVSCIVF